MAGGPCRPWRSLQICQVVDAGTIWVREVPSQTCSEELLQFLEMEELMSHYFSNNCSQDPTDHASFVRIGNPVVVRYNDCWARGRVEKVPDASGEKPVVFLLDYGITIVAEVLTIIPLSNSEWASVPYQARKISLFGVTPASLQYSFVNQEVKVVLKHSEHWDSSATEYVRLLSSKTPQVEFTPVVVSQGGCLYGKLLVILPKETCASLIPESSKSHWVQRGDNQMAIDLAQLLVDCEFGELWKDYEENFNSGSSFDSDHTHLSKRHFSGYCLTSQNSETSGDTLKQKYMRESPGETLSELSTTSSENDVGLVVTDETPASLCRKSRSFTTKETAHTSVCLKMDTKKQAESGSIGGSQKKSMELKSHLCDNNENFNIRLTNDCDNLSSAGVTCPLLKGLSSEHLGISRNNIFSSMLKPKFHSEVSRHKGNIKMPEDESIRHEICNKEVNQSECSRSNLMGELCRDIEKGCISEKIGADNTMDTAKPVKLMAGGYINSRDSHGSTEKSDLTNIPKWVCTSLVGAVCDLELAVQRGCSRKDNINLSEGENFEINEGKKVSANSDFADSIENLGQRKQMLAAAKKKQEIKKSKFQNTSASIVKMCHTLNKSDVRGMLTNLHTTGLDEMHTTVIEQYSPHSISKIVRAYRVFVAGGPHILDEEVVINKDILHTTLNSHIAKVLCKKGMNATRVQAYTWPALIRGCSAVIVGEKSCGKTLGYVIPLLSTILDTHQHTSHRLPPGIGPVMVLVFSTWQSARCVADHVDSLLPAGTTLKTITAWGGCGAEEEIRTGKQLLEGCDILLTTAPCLIRLLTGNPTLQAGGTEEAITTLTRCCHLVIDEADIVLRNFSTEVKQIMTMWGEERKKCSRSDMELQAVLVSSKWTKSVSQLTHILLPLLDPTIIISAPSEAAIATNVRSYIYCVKNMTEAYGMVMNLIAFSYSQKKNMVFVKSDSDADMLGSMMKNVAVYCLVSNSTVCMDKLQQLVHEWHVMQGVTMIVSEKSEASLLYHDLADAQTIFHTHIGSSWTTFSHRYGFMVDNFVTDVEQKSVDCESYIIVPQFSLARIPKVWNELSRICGKAAEEVVVNLLSAQVGPSEDTAICYYLKAYGSCFEESCKFRHEFHYSDICHNVPKAGKVTFEVMKVLNASRYLVCLTEYQDKSDGQTIDLSSHCHIMKSALHQHYADTSHHQPLSYVEKGTLCAVQDAGQWSRAEVVSVNYSKATTLIEVFLIDEGKEITLNLSSALFLPLYLANIPQLIVEVFLCCIQPLDQDREWTPQATNFVCEVFAKNKKSRFVGQIALALGHTLWLNPVVEFSKIGKKYIQKKSLRGKLLSERFGMDNPNHVKNLEELCSLARVPFRHEDVFIQRRIEALNEALQEVQIAGDTDDLNTDTLTCDKIATEINATIQNKENIVDDILHSGDGFLNTLEIYGTKIVAQLEAGKDDMTISSGSSLATQFLAHEELPIDTEMRVHMAEVVSPEEFYVIREDRHQELDALEAEIDHVHDFLEYCEGERKSCHHSSVKSSEFKPSLGVLCIAKYTDKKYYRGQVTGGDPDGSMLVFFIDHGETVEVPSWQIHACPRVWVECLPGQAIRCCLAHLSIPPPLRQAATRAMLHLADITDSWTVKALEVRDEDGPLYVVELKDSASSPQVEMYKELFHQVLALIDTEMVPSDGEDTSVLLNASNIDNQEIEDFFLGLSAVNQDMTKKPKRVKPEVQMKCNTTDVEAEPRNDVLPHTASISEANPAYESVEQNSTNDSVDNGKKSEDISPNVKNECSESISRGLDPLPNRNSGRKLCSIVVNHSRDGNWEVTEKNKVWNFKESNQDVNVVQTSGRNICNRRYLRVPPLSAVDGVTRRLFPETSWSQKEDKVHITIHLVGVEQHKCCVSSSHLMFMCTLGDKFYVLDEELSHEVITDASVVSILGIYVSITLKKATEGKWISLFKDRRHRLWLRGNYEKLSSGNSSETENYDDDGWREYFKNNKELPMGGLPAGISDTDGITDTDDSENSDQSEKY